MIYLQFTITFTSTLPVEVHCFAMKLTNQVPAALAAIGISADGAYNDSYMILGAKPKRLSTQMGSNSLDEVATKFT